MQQQQTTMDVMRSGTTERVKEAAAHRTKTAPPAPPAPPTPYEANAPYSG